MLSLNLRMSFLLIALFGILYAIASMVGAYIGITNFYFYLVLALVFMFIQYLIGPKLVEWTMGVRYIKRSDNPHLFQMVEELARKAKIPTPKIGISAISLPNAFAFGRGVKDGRVCVTEGIMRLLDEDEIKAVLGHEICHLKNRDVLTITILSVIPMVLYRLAFQFLFLNRRRDSERGANAVLVGILALAFYFITNLLVLYASRIREYFADKGSVALGNKPSSLASALYKLVYGAARIDKDELKQYEGLKAFFINDPSQALNEIKELKELDNDKSGTIDMIEMQQLRNKNIRLSFGDKFLEALSTHPNMLKRIKKLSEYK